MKYSAMPCSIEDENKIRDGYLAIIKSTGHVFIDGQLRPIRSDEKVSPILHFPKQKQFEYDDEAGMVFDLSRKPNQEEGDEEQQLTEEEWSALLQYYS